MLVKPIHLVPPSARSTAAATPFAMQLQREMRGEVMFGNADRGRYATDASIYQIMPLGVVVPRDQADLKLALDIAVLARGAGTS
ncbi:FAD-binding oxidoreductase, partial [Herbaspirillum lusitanum]|uniref:FAD-binding oxidoreductase n=1 Tax=Herbaspirillum lusitanum TaxID=213312 RepID=UPI001427E3BE